MSFFGIGPTEMVVIAVVALMLFNPRELPKMLRSIAKFWGQLRATADEFKDTIMNADGVDELQEMVKGTKGQIKQVENDARRELMKARAEMRKAQQKLIKANQAKLQQQQEEIAAKKAERSDDEADSEAQPPEAPVASAAPHDRTPPGAPDAPPTTEAHPAEAQAEAQPEPSGGDDRSTAPAAPAAPASKPGGNDDAHNQGAA